MKKNRIVRLFLCASVLLLFPLPGLFCQSEESISDEDEPVADFGLSVEKAVSVKGSAGGGFPGDFYGDFSAVSTDDENPFEVSFSHSSRNGFGTHEAADGYFCTATEFSAEKTFSLDAFAVTAGGSYRRNGTGLQDRSPCFFDVHSQNIAGSVFAQREFAGGFSLRAGTGGNWYSRYAGVRSKECSFSSYEKRAGVFSLAPEAEFLWKGKSLSAGVRSRINFEAACGSFIFSGAERVFRADASVFAGWNIGMASFSACGGAVFGTETGSSNSCIPFFSAGVSFQDSGSSEQSFFMEICGGLDSRLVPFSEAEERFAFSVLGMLPGETTDWFASARIRFPVSGAFSVRAASYFRKTAFGNGEWEADYGKKTEAGLFSVRPEERTLFQTDAGVHYSWNNFSFGAGCKTNWLHVPSDEFRVSVTASLSFDSETGKQGFSVCAEEFISSDSDKCPVLGGTAWHSFSPSFSAAVRMSDVLKLFSRTDREYRETGYLVRSGSAEIFARFSF